MFNATTKNFSFPWQLIMAWTVGILSVTNIVIINIFSLETIRGSIWIRIFPLTYVLCISVTIDAFFRENITRRKITWILLSATHFLLFFKFAFQNITRNNDTFIITGVFAFTILGLIVFFPKSIWSIGSVIRVICDITVLSFSIISLSQSGIYYFFGETESSRSAAKYVVWVGFEIAGFINTIFLWYYYRQRIMGLIVLAALCIVLADVVGTIRQWYPGVYRLSGLPDHSFNYLQKMNIMLFAYYSIDHFVDLPSYKQRIISTFEVFYRIGVPYMVLLISLILTIFLHPPDTWVTITLFAVAFIQLAVSLNEIARLFARVFGNRAELAEALERRQIAAAEVAHDMGNALQDVRLALAQVRSTLPLETARTHQLDAAEIGVGFAIDMISPLVAAAQLDAGALKLSLQTTPATALVQRVLQQQEPHALAQGVQLHLDLALDLPPVRCDPNLVQRALANIISNAVKYTGAARPGTGLVLISAERLDDRVQIAVIDNGPGIAPDDLARVRQRFVRGGGAGAPAGFGLGLSFAYGVIDQHPLGNLQIESAAGAGTTVLVTLAAATPDQEIEP